MNRSAILKSIAACCIVLGMAASPVAASVGPLSLQVRIDNAVAGGGLVRIAMFDRRSWLSDDAVDAASAAADGPSIVVRLSAPRAGRYGLAAYQDLNGDGRLNRNIVGLPTEPVAFSNDAAIRFGPPSFEDAAVNVGEDGVETIVRLR